jgi:uncharacterized protein
MFIDFFFFLHERGLKVSLSEWMTLMQALSLGLEDASLSRFYNLCRALCVKRESQLDLFDQCFAAYFKDLEPPPSLKDELEQWLQNPLARPDLTPEQLAALEHLDLDELRRRFQERMDEQSERHDGGNRWIGTGGTSPFGHGGVHPGGIRVGGNGGGGMASQIAGMRRFANLRSDRILDVRQLAVALKKLRELARDGAPSELDLDATIDATAQNAGDIELIFEPARRNTTKLLLLMDVGGSMTPFTRLCELLFSAAHKSSHFKSFKHYFFHNCPYEALFTDIELFKTRPTLEVIEELDKSWFCFIVGDAAMHPYELFSVGGAISYSHHNYDPGIRWLTRLAQRVPRTAWLNPSPQRFWTATTTEAIRQVFPMYPLTVEGLQESIRDLKKKPV